MVKVLSAKWVIPVEPENTILEDHSVVIENDKIVEILPTAEANSKYASAEKWVGEDSVLMPGFVNSHTHSSMTLLRGLADDLSLMPWLTEHIWPAEGKFVDPTFVYEGAKMAMAEMLKGGTTMFSDMYFFPDAVGKAANEVGMRVMVGLITIGFPSAYAGKPDNSLVENATAYLQRGREVYKEMEPFQPLVSCAVAPHAPYSCGEDGLKLAKEMADDLKIPFHIHLQETPVEVDDWKKANNDERPVATLHRLGLVNDKLIAVHMTQATDDEIKILSDAGASVVHCPESNMKLASGTCRVADMLAAKINVGIGTDGCASNNDLDMFSEMKTAAFLGKLTAKSPEAIPAHQAIYMATMGSAKALGVHKMVGSLVPGKAADIQAVSLSGIESLPVYNCASHIVYCTGRSQVSDVWVNGRQLLKNRQLTTINEPELIVKAKEWGVKIRANDEKK